MILSTDQIRIILRAIRDAEREFEAMEDSHDWYTASPKLMNRLEEARKLLEAAL